MKTIETQANTLWTQILLTLIALGWALAALVATAGHANAAPVGDVSSAFTGSAGDGDQYAMYSDVIDFAPTVTPSVASGFAQRICTMLRDGTSEGQIIYAGSSQFNVDPTAVRYLVHASEWHYCPEMY